MLFETHSPKVHCRDCAEKSCASAVLGQPELDLLHENSRQVSFLKGDILVQEGSLTSNIIYLRSGLVKEYTRGANGREQIVQIIRQFSYLGLSSLFGDRVNRYSYAALEDAEVCYIDIALFTNLVRQNGAFAYEILVSVSRDNLHSFHRFVNQSQKKSFGRVADAVLYFSRIIFEQPAFDLPFTRQEFADLVGITRESLARVLTGFSQDKILEVKGKRIVVLKPDVLERISKNG